MQRTRVWPAADPRQLGQGFAPPKGVPTYTDGSACSRCRSLRRIHRAEQGRCTFSRPFADFVFEQGFNPRRGLLGLALIAPDLLQIINDLTARDLQQRHAQWFLGKSLDGFCPMGPVFVTADEIGDPTTLTLSLSVDGERRQHATVKDMIFDIPELIATISSVMTLEPGDIIATGTPEGVAVGFDPPRFLQHDSVVEASIDRIGALRNRIEFVSGS